MDQNGQPTTDGASILNNGALLPLGGISPITGINYVSYNVLLHFFLNKTAQGPVAQKLPLMVTLPSIVITMKPGF